MLNEVPCFSKDRVSELFSVLEGTVEHKVNLLKPSGFFTYHQV